LEKTTPQKPGAVDAGASAVEFANRYERAIRMPTGIKLTLL
jgi:hypothetical protein